MFPERQLGPHKEWKAEVEYLDAIFPNGSAYTVGKVNGDHWLLYMTEPPSTMPGDETRAVDSTIEILMTQLSPACTEQFFLSQSPAEERNSPSTHGLDISSKTGISDLFPPHLTTLDAYSFTPCGYSSNALLKSEIGPSEGYHTIHVTPESGWSYASFECNALLPTSFTLNQNSFPDLQTLVRRVVNIFQPAKLTLTLFISSPNIQEEISSVEAAQTAFRLALTSPSRPNGGSEHDLVYRRTDKINYEFGSYDLAFASFELSSTAHFH